MFEPSRTGVASWRSRGHGVSSLLKRRISFSLWSLALLGGAIAVGATAQTLHAQEAPAAIHDGDAIVTGFSGVSEPAGDLPRGVDPSDETFIDADAASLKIFDLAKPGQPVDGQLFTPPVRFQAKAGDIGQVFGVALDDAPAPNIYTTATSAFGLQIVAPDRDGDGHSERLKTGAANARWMKGQFGTEKGGGPGSIWKIDGVTGEVTLFANVETDGRANSGPALGNITFDSDHQQLYVSDLDTGMIHRFDLTGRDIGYFDHGVEGRPAQNLGPVAFDPENKFEITSESVDITDPATWGFADDRRQVWGVTYADGRVYYAVADGPQIWSVGITDDGRFSDDVRWELDPAVNKKGGPISDIALTASGDIILAQRGARAADYDYSVFQEPGNSRVLRYSLETPDEPRTKSRWKTEPHDYAIGFSANQQNGAGGIAIGYGYAQGGDGAIDFDVCDGTLWTTGDLLRKRTDLRRELAKGGKLAVNGLQGNALSLVRPDNVPPWKSLFVDFDGGFSGPDAFGHVGDIAVMRRCLNERADTPPVAGPPVAAPPVSLPPILAPPVDVPLEDAPIVVIPGEDVPPVVVIPDGDVPPIALPFVDLALEKWAFSPQCLKGEKCGFTLSVVNVSNVFFVGPIKVGDPDPVAGLGSNTIGWDCEWDGGETHCRTAAVLAPGERRSFDIVFDIPADFVGETLENCASILWDGPFSDANLGNDDACASVEIVELNEPPLGAGPDLGLTKTVSGTCTLGQECGAFTMGIQNLGTEEFVGPIVVRDAFPMGISFAGVAPNSSWSCLASGLGAVECTHAGPLAAGASLPDLKPLFDVSPDFGADSFGIFSRIVGQDMRQDANPDNNIAFESVDVEPAVADPAGPPKPDLVISKKVPLIAGPMCKVRDAKRRCTFTVAFGNQGNAPYSGRISFTDRLRADAVLVEFSPLSQTPWDCVQDGNEVTCSVLVENMAPDGADGFGHGVRLVIELPNTPQVIGTMNNCAVLSEPVNDPEAGNVSCARISLCDPSVEICPADIAVRKVRAMGGVPGFLCTKGASCRLGTVIANTSSHAYNGPLSILETLPDGFEITEAAVLIVAREIVCAPGQTGATCNFDVELTAGNGLIYETTIDIPIDYAGDSFESCATLDTTGLDDALAANNGPVCVVVPLIDVVERAAEIDPPARFPRAAGPRRDEEPVTRPERKEVPEPAKTPPASERAPVTERPPVSCQGGKLVSGDCVCRSGYTRKKLSSRSFRCDRNRPTITCTGGTVKKNACVCPSSAVRKRINATTFRCETPPITRPTITCSGGTVKKNVCTCPANTEKVKRSNTSWYCKPKPKTCSGGRIYDSYLKQCTCPSSKPIWNAKKKQCEQKPAVITVPTCKSGQSWNGKRKRCECSVVKRRRIDGKCCPAGTEARFNRCVKVPVGQITIPGVKTPVVIRCDRGTVRKGQCICPKGYTRKTLKKNVYACNKPVSQSNPGTQTGPSVTTPPKITKPPKLTTPPKLIRPPKLTTPPKLTKPSKQVTSPKKTGASKIAPAGIQCIGGKVRGKLCRCGFGKFPKKVSSNVYRCP